LSFKINGDNSAELPAEYQRSFLFSELAELAGRDAIVATLGMCDGPA
jgi:hypothetical protein